MRSEKFGTGSDGHLITRKDMGYADRSTEDEQDDFGQEAAKLFLDVNLRLAGSLALDSLSTVRHRDGEIGEKQLEIQGSRRNESSAIQIPQLSTTLPRYGVRPPHVSNES